MTAQLIASEHPIDFWRSIAGTALRVLRPFIKMSGEQSAAWDIVVGLIGGI